MKATEIPDRAAGTRTFPVQSYFCPSLRYSITRILRIVLCWKAHRYFLHESVEVMQMTRRIYFLFNCKHIVVLTNNTRLVLTEVKTAVLCDNQMEQVNTLCIQNAETCLMLTFKNRASYIQDGRTTTLQMLHYIYIFPTNISTEYFKHAADSPFFSSKCRLFHNATFFGYCIIHILHTGRAKI